jgi:hypothetical protein
MLFRYSAHALQRLDETRIPRTVVEAVLASPQQKLTERNGITCFQSLASLDEKQFLLRVLVNEAVEPALIVTLYRTSKIDKYFRR